MRLTHNSDPTCDASANCCSARSYHASIGFLLSKSDSLDITGGVHRRAENATFLTIRLILVDLTRTANTLTTQVSKCTNWQPYLNLEAIG